MHQSRDALMLAMGYGPDGRYPQVRLVRKFSHSAAQGDLGWVKASVPRVLVIDHVTPGVSHVRPCSPIVWWWKQTRHSSRRLGSEEDGMSAKLDHKEDRFFSLNGIA